MPVVEPDALAELDLPRGVVERLPGRGEVRGHAARLEIADGEVVEDVVAEDDRLAQDRVRRVPAVHVRLERIDEGVVLRLRHGSGRQDEDEREKQEHREAAAAHGVLHCEKCRHDGAKSPGLSNATIGGVKDAVLVTGGAGFIGSHLVERLLADGARVRVFDNFSTGTRANFPFAAKFRGRLEVIRGDVRNRAAIVRAARGARVIFHQAAMRSVPRSVKDPLGANENNVNGTLHVLEAARRCRVRRVVYASSSSVYGARPDLP
ncbi:MAG: NAD-dependent epimerase/dehydratase family protein, partial [Candidatus Rokubacteria bacterium]|nr:NAD-dependent epimerase/dehydratase family protein [Candidatus Rokubacteria bacterium]